MQPTTNFSNMTSYLNEERPRSSLSHFNILLAEDDPDDQDMIREAFKEINISFSLHVVENGNHVFDYLNKLPDHTLPDLIILDYNMPELNGAQVLQKLCEHNRYTAIPKVILSTSNNIKFIQEAEEKGAHAYRVKPSNFLSLVAIAREMIELCKAA